MVFLSHGNPRKDKYALEQLSISSPTVFQTYPTNPIHGLRDWLSFVLVITIQLSHVSVLVVFKSFGVVFSLLILRTMMEFQQLWNKNYEILQGRGSHFVSQHQVE